MAGLGPREEARPGNVALRVRDVHPVRDGFGRVFGDVPGLRIEPGEESRVDTLEVVTAGGTRTVDTAAPPGSRERSG